MNKKALIALAVIIAIALVGFGAYAFLTSPTKAPSKPSPTSERPTSTQPQTPPAEASAPSTDAPTGTYRIISEESKATFSIFEMLRGEPNTVIGTTANISGYVSADPTNLASTTISEIRINARAFQTDAAQRDNMIRRAILKTEDDANEFIVFTPKSITGLATSTKLGAEFTYKVMGDLLIAGITKEVTFDGTGKFASDTELTGTAKTTIKRADFNLIVPSFPFLADVADEVPLQIDFVAKKAL